MYRLALIGLGVIAIVIGAPYTALILNNLMGTYSVVTTGHDGRPRTLILGPGADIPDWMPQLPGGLVVQAGRWLPVPGAPDGGDLEVLSHRGFDEVNRFYRQAFERGGFTVADLGGDTLNAAAAAAMIGLDGQLAATRGDRGLLVTIRFRRPDGLIVRPRLVQIHWTQGPVAPTAP